MAEKHLTIIAKWKAETIDELPGMAANVWADFPAAYQVRDISGNEDPTIGNPNVFWVRCDETLIPTIEAHPDYYIHSEEDPPQEI